MNLVLQIVDPVSKKSLSFSDLRGFLSYDKDKLFNGLKTSGWIAISYAKQVRPPQVISGEMNRGYDVAEYKDSMMIKIGSAKFYWKFQEYGTMQYGMLAGSQTARKGGIKPKLMAHKGIVLAKDLIANELSKALVWKK